MIAKDSFSYRLLEIVDPDSLYGLANLTITTESISCPFIKGNSERLSIEVDYDVTSDEDVGSCNFTVVLSDGYKYGMNSTRYEAKLEIVRSNETPYFAEVLPSQIKFKAEGSLEFILPDKIDSHNDTVDVLINRASYFPWLSYDPVKNALVVEEGTTTADDMGTYQMGLTLDDGYEYGTSTTDYFYELFVDVPFRPFHVYEPKNEPPVFVEPLTEDEI